MLASSISKPLGRVAVLDIETSYDPYALALLKRSAGRREAPAAIHRIFAASALFATERVSDVWEDLSIQSVSAIQDEPAGEERILTAIDGWLGRLDAAGGILVTYNGRRHDLPVIARRAARHLNFSATLMDAARRRHLDMLEEMRLGFGSLVSLRDAAWTCPDKVERHWLS